MSWILVDKCHSCGSFRGTYGCRSKFKMVSREFHIDRTCFNITINFSAPILLSLDRQLIDQGIKHRQHRTHRGGSWVPDGPVEVEE